MKSYIFTGEGVKVHQFRRNYSPETAQITHVNWLHHPEITDYGSFVRVELREMKYLTVDPLDSERIFL